jgi:hypothetical protein
MRRMKSENWCGRESACGVRSGSFVVGEEGRYGRGGEGCNFVSGAGVGKAWWGCDGVRCLRSS